MTPIGMKLGIVALSGVSAYDSDAKAFFDAIEEDGGSLNDTEKGAVNTMVESLKTNSLWTEFYVLYPIVGGTATTHKYNIKDPQDTDAAFRLTFGGGITHSSTGMLPNGTNGYAKTHFKPGNDFDSMTSTSYHVYLRTNVLDTNDCDMGFYQGTNPYYYSMIWTYHPSATFWDSQGYAGWIAAQQNPTTKLISMNRESGTSLKGYRDGSQVGSTDTDAPGSIVGTNNDVNIMARSHPSTGHDLYSARENALAAIGKGLSDSQVSDFNDIVVAYQTALSRNV